MKFGGALSTYSLFARFCFPDFPSASLSSPAYLGRTDRRRDGAGSISAVDWAPCFLVNYTRNHLYFKLFTIRRMHRIRANIAICRIGAWNRCRCSNRPVNNHLRSLFPGLLCFLPALRLYSFSRYRPRATDGRSASI